jgi:hypothetical protein
MSFDTKSNIQVHTCTMLLSSGTIPIYFFWIECLLHISRWEHESYIRYPPYLTNVDKPRDKPPPRNLEVPIVPIFQWTVNKHS